MITSLEIENFRCFGKSKLSGFARVNLIGGQNNSGKTAFLEALYLNRSPRAATVMKMRGISQESIKSFPERAWNGLFLNHDNQLTASIISIDKNDVSAKLRLSQHLFPSENRGYVEGVLDNYFNTKDLNEVELKQFKTELFDNHREFLSILEISYESDKYGNSSQILVTTGAIKIIERNFNPQNISFISATEKASSRYLAEQYDKCYMQGYSGKVLAAFHIIDPSVVEIRTLMSGEPTIYLSRAKQRPMSLALFGDAMNRVAHVVLELLNNQSSILLIDEIENGLHHTHQKQLWEWLFALAVKFDVQIFATTHSLEMLTAFKEAAMGTQYESEVAYFEFARHVKTGEIIAVERDIDNLDYALERHKEVRGG